MHVYTIVHIMELLMNYMYMIIDVYFVECIQLYWLWNAAYFCYSSWQSAVIRWGLLLMLMEKLEQCLYKPMIWSLKLS
mgnify:CR=1 FL=1